MNKWSIWSWTLFPSSNLVQQTINVSILERYFLCLYIQLERLFTTFANKEYSIYLYKKLNILVCTPWPKVRDPLLFSPDLWFSFDIGVLVIFKIELIYFGRAINLLLRIAITWLHHYFYGLLNHYDMRLTQNNYFCFYSGRKLWCIDWWFKCNNLLLCYVMHPLRYVTHFCKRFTNFIVWFICWTISLNDSHMEERKFMEYMEFKMKAPMNQW
jgi:hypothetical protein